MKRLSPQLLILLTTYFAGWLLYALFSFSLTDPNLTLTAWPPYTQFQNFMWQTFFLNAQLLSLSFGILMTLLSLLYIAIVTFHTAHGPGQNSHWRLHILVGILVAAPLLMSYNALSHDIFNYLFNAKMVAVYGADPHTQVALDFAEDPWTRFMHNTHTPAPYGRGWTWLSLLPFWIGSLIGQPFVPTWLLFRGMAVLSWMLLIATLTWSARLTGRGTLQWSAIGLVLFSPLVVIEVISNGHNDLWMMFPAVAALSLLAATQRRWWWIALSAGLLAASISIKLATLALLPIFGILLLHQWLPTKLRTTLLRYWPLAASLLMFVPLLTSRSQQFHPWYLLWVLSWLPLLGAAQTKCQLKLQWFEQLWQTWVLALSISSLFRYLPWLLAGNFKGDVFRHQKLVTWLMAASLTALWFGWQMIRRSAARSR